MTPTHRTTINKERGRVTVLDNGLKLITDTPYQLSALVVPDFMTATAPPGQYPIHIVVKNGRTTLYGSVSSQMDKRMAEIRAREVSGAFSVDNRLVVESD